MKLTPMTITLSLGSLFFAYLTIKAAYRNKIGARTAFLWIIIWLSVAFFSVYPATLDGLIGAAGMVQRVLFVLIIAVAALLAITFHLMSKLDGLNHDLSRAIQEISLINYRLDQALKNKSTGKK